MAFEGLEHLFSGLAQGVGETKLSLEKEKRERADREQQTQLQTLTALLAQPGLKPEHRSELFRQALNVASGGDKKITNDMFNVLGPLLTQEQGAAPAEGGGQAGGVRTSPQQAVPKADVGGGGASPLPSSGLPKLGSSGGGQPSLFYTPEEETSQLANRAGAVTSATAKAQGDVDMENYKKKLDLEIEKEKQLGWHLTGYTSPNKVTGMSAPIFQNDSTQQVKIGTEQVPHFLTAEGLNSIAVNEATREQARQEAIHNMAVTFAKDPNNITPQEMQQAEKKWADLNLQSMEAGIGGQKAQAFRDIATGTAAMDKSSEQGALTQQQLAMDYNRQRDEYERQSTEIQKAVAEVNDAKREASEAYNNAMVIKNYLESQHLDPNGSENPTDEAAIAQGLTPARYQVLLGDAKTALSRARSAADSARSRFGASVEAGPLSKEGGFDESPGKWPYLKDIRQGFSYNPQASGFPAMPVPKGSSSKSKRTTGIEVPNRLLQELGLTP
jgi:hypothetical protein